MAQLCTIRRIPTVVIPGQKPGTSGLRKPTRTFMEPHYTENFCQSILNSCGEGEGSCEGQVFVVGGDGRFYSVEAIEKIISICAANKVSKLIIGQNGILSTPAVSHLIRKRSTFGGILLTASHNPGGIDEDFGIKYNVSSGGPAPEQITDKIQSHTIKIKEYYIVENFPKVDLSVVGQKSYEIEGKQFTIEIIDSVQDYLELMKEIFDFNKLKEFLSKFPILVDGMNGVTGPYIEKIFGQELNCKNLINTKPLPDFGGMHPDPNLTYAKGLVDEMVKGFYEFGTAYDGDGDRNMIIGKNGFFVNPCDTLAILAANLQIIPYFQKKKINGFARSMPTSQSIDMVGKKLGFNVYQVPTGWKFFGNLMDSDLIDLCGEESFGTGSNHIREKDGLWTTLAFLSILAEKNSTVQNLLESHWSQFGRNYFQRLDYEGLDAQKAQDLMNRLEKKILDPDFKLENLEKADNYEYRDPVDGSFSSNQGLRILFKDGSRIVLRLSGTGSSGATLRVYIEKYCETDFSKSKEEVLKELTNISLELSNLKELLGVESPTVVT